MSRLKKTAAAVLAALTVMAGTMLSASAIGDPDVSHANAYLVYCIESDTVVWAKNSDVDHFPTALVKLMTALIAVDCVDNGILGIDDYITASATAVHSATGNTIGIVTGERLRLSDLIGAMMLTGANDATLMIAEALAGSVPAFVDMMNEKAEQLGMTHTLYTNPTGLHDTRMTTTAEDLLILAKYAINNQFLKDLCKTERIEIAPTNKSGERYYGTRNYLVSDRVSQDYYLPMATGMICGSTTEAGFCIIATAQHDGLDYIAIILGADTTTVELTPRTLVVDDEGNPIPDENGNEVYVPATYDYIMNGFVEARYLLNWIDGNYGYIKAVDTSTPICQVGVKLAKSIDKIALLPETALEIYVPLDIDRDKDIDLDWTLDSDTLTAPVRAGARVGILTVKYNGNVIGEVPLVVRSNIEASGWLSVIEAAKQLLSTTFFKVAIIVIISCAVAYIIINARARQIKRNAARKKQLKLRGDGYRR